MVLNKCLVFVTKTQNFGGVVTTLIILNEHDTVGWINGTFYLDNSVVSETTSTSYGHVGVKSFSNE
jgi:hypothetical protein